MNTINLNKNQVSFEDFLINNDYQIPQNIVKDEKIYRFGKNDNCWYWCNDEIGMVGDWSSGEKLLWKNHEVWSSYSEVQKRTKENEIRERQEENEKLRKEIHEQSALKAQAIYNKADVLNNQSHGYAVKKKLSEFIHLDPSIKLSIYENKKHLIVPIYNIQNELRTLQFIDEEGNKKLMKGGEKRGCFHIIGNLEDSNEIFFVEGFSTALSIYSAIKKPVVMCIDSGNIKPVFEAFRGKYPNKKITICGENDQYLEVNIGKQKAEEVAKEFDCSVILPKFKDLSSKPTDFNDLHCLEGLEEVGRQLDLNSVNQKPIISEWSDPIEIEYELEPVNKLLDEMLPEPYKNWVIDAAHRKQTATDIIAISSIVATGSVLSTKCGIKPKRNDPYIIAANIWGFACLPSGFMKTDSIKDGLFPLNLIENETKNKYEDDLTSYKRKYEIFELRTRGLKAEIEKQYKKDFDAEPVELINKLHSIEIPKKPKCKRFLVNDVTIEKLGEILSENDSGILVFRDELIALMSRWEKEEHSAERAFYLEAWNGFGSITTDRIARGTTRVEKQCVSIFGAIQPDRLKQFLKRSINNIGDDGLIQRFQMTVYPDIPKTWRKIDQAENKESKQRFLDIIKKITTMNFDEFGAKFDTEKEIHYYSFSNEAQEFYYSWLSDIENRIRSQNDHNLIISHISKYRKLVPALALIFHVIDLVSGKNKTDSNDISLKTLEIACAWCDYLESHAKRIYYMVLEGEMKSAKTLANKIKNKQVHDNFSKRDIERKRWSDLVKTDEIKSAIDILLEYNWIKEERTEPKFQSKGRTLYKINPKIYE